MLLEQWLLAGLDVGGPARCLSHCGQEDRSCQVIPVWQRVRTEVPVAAESIPHVWRRFRRYRIGTNASPVEMKPSFRYASLWCFLLLLCARMRDAQVCRLSVAGVNRERRVMGSIAADVPNPLHPLATGAVAVQFWPEAEWAPVPRAVHDMRVCDNAVSA